MKQKSISLIILLVLAVSSVACAAQKVSGASNETPGDSAGSSAVAQDQAILVEALRNAGAEVELGTSVEQAFFSVPGQILKVNDADLQVFEYESAEAMGTEASQVSKDGGSIGTSMVTWIDDPHFFRSGRVLVLYVGGDREILGLLEGVLGEQFAGR